MSEPSAKPFAGLEKEALICGRCGYCRSACPVYNVIGWESAAPRGKISMAKEIFSHGNRCRIAVRSLCTGWRNAPCAGPAPASVPPRSTPERCGWNCGNASSRWVRSRRPTGPCGTTCSPGRIFRPFPMRIGWNGPRIWMIPMRWSRGRARRSVISWAAFPRSFRRPPRSRWPSPRYLPEAGVDFTTMGGEEWCCGFPLISTGFVDDSKAFIRHNVEKIKELDIHTLVASCASCYHVWKHDSREELQGYDLEILHTTEYLARLIREGRIPMHELAETVTYHDPCDLGRNSGIYDAPREIIRAIPGVRFVELPHHHEGALCCGGGGNLQSVDADLATEIARLRTEEIRAVGATIVVSACQQCEQMLTAAVRKAKLPVRVMDVSQLILEAMG